MSFPKALRLSAHAAAIAAATLCWCNTASAQMVLYDNFSSNVISPVKWGGVPGDPAVLDELRVLQVIPGHPGTKQLHIRQIAYGLTTDNSSSSGGLYGLSFSNPARINAVTFTTVLNKLKVVDCVANPTTRGGPEFRGNFFSTVASPTSDLNDVGANIGISLNLGQTSPTAVGFVYQGDGTVLGYQILGPITVGTAYTLSIRWDQPNHQFIFQMNNDTPVVESYTVSDINPPFSPGKYLSVARLVTSCTAKPRPYALIDADFRNVYVNQ
jgi:hypothetical protein